MTPDSGLKRYVCAEVGWGCTDGLGLAMNRDQINIRSALGSHFIDAYFLCTAVIVTRGSQVEVWGHGAMCAPSDGPIFGAGFSPIISVYFSTRQCNIHRDIVL